MNSKRDFDRAVDRWLDDGSDATPLAVIDAVLLAVRRMPQERRFWWPAWRTNGMNIYAKLIVAAAAMLVVAIGAYQFVPGRSGVGGTNATPSPSPAIGRAVPVPYSFLGGEVSFAAAPPWGDTTNDPTFTVLGGVGRGSASQHTMFAVVADPLTGVGCEAGPAPADADALVRSLRSNPDLEVTAPAAVSVGEIDALRMDVLAPGQPGVDRCAAAVLERVWLTGAGRMRLYVLDLPEGMSARILAIAISALDSEFEIVMEAATPILDSFEFHTP